MPSLFKWAVVLAAAAFCLVDPSLAHPHLAKRNAITFVPHNLPPSPGSAPVRLKSWSFDPASKAFSGEVWVDSKQYRVKKKKKVANLAFNKVVSVFWSTPTLQWVNTNRLNASYVSSDTNNYEVWRFSGTAPSIDLNSQFYLTYNVLGQTYYDSNGGPAFNYVIENPTIGTPEASTLDTCTNSGIKRKLYTVGPTRYLVLEVLSDVVVHFEVSESRRPNPNLKIYNTPMIDEENLPKRFCGPSSLVDNGNVLETPAIRITIDASTLSASIFDKIKGIPLTTYTYSNLASGQANNNANPPNLVLEWTRELTESVYGIAASPSFDNPGLSSEGNWFNRQLSPPNPFQGGPEGFGNTLVGVQNGAMVYVQLPVVYNLGSNGYQHAFFLDDQHRHDWDLTKPNFKVTARGPRALRWYAIAGSSLADLRRTYLKIVGPTIVPPKSAFGLQISKFGYKGWQETNFEVDGIVNQNFPLDAVIYDLYWFGGFNRFGDLAWDQAAFPDTIKNLQALRAKGPAAILIEEPYLQVDRPTWRYLRDQKAIPVQQNGQPTLINGFWGRGSYVDHSAAAGTLWSTCKRCKLIAGCVVPSTCPATLESTPATDLLIAHWQDLGEPETFDANAVYAGIKEDDGFTLTNHRSVANLYQFLKTKNTFELYQNQTLQRRPVILARSAAAGMQRYGALTWSGDIPSFAPAVASSFGQKKHLVMAGLDLHSSDIGGFQRRGCQAGCDLNKLYTVWYSSSVWLDISVRPHVQAFEDFARSFTASPAAIGDLASNRFNTQIRYFLLPLYYSLSHLAARNGDPIITPLFLRYPEDKNVRSNGNQFLVGPIMVAFTADTNTQSRGVYLPTNTEWYNFHTNQRVLGTGAFTEVSFFPFGGTLFTVPALAQAGSIFPTAYVDEKTRNSRFQDRKDNTIVHPYQVRVYPGPKSTFVATDDDGETQAYSLSGAYSTTELTQELTGSTATVSIAAAKGYFPGLNTRRQLIVEVVIPAGFNGVASVTVDGQALALNPLASALSAQQGYKLFGVNNRIVGIYGPIGSVYAARTVVVRFN
ncbi:hypothetical protein HDU97_003773 [Phlyctochytrium planicorne]|nr:hypothetical protein HDU97_003773 [Phlyctochytrium planicorne]